MPTRPQGRPELVEYDVRYMTINFRGNTASGWVSFSWDASKNHGFDDTPDGQFLKTHGSPEVTFSLTVKVTSNLVPALTASYDEEEGWFTASARESPDAGYGGIRFVGCTTTDVSQDDAEIDNTHEISVDVRAADVEFL